MQFKKIHFIGVGGIGMSAIAQMLTRLGYEVSGSDVKESAITRHLSESGVRIRIGHSASNLGEAECVVFSSSIARDNPEIAAAQRNGLAVKHRSEMLAFLSSDKWTAAVSGTHGKSTTTSMLGFVYERCGKNPTVVVGAKVEQFGGGNLLLGAGPDMILEADESDASFLQYSPDAIIITNIDSDHLDYFRDLDEIEAVFCQFLGKLKTGGRFYGCAEDARVRRLLVSDKARRGVSYGFGPQWDYSAASPELVGRGGARFTLCRAGKRLGEVAISLYGLHNILNATAVCALALDQGLGFDAVRAAIKEYRGATRRFDLKFISEELTIVDDYAHHPTELRRTLEAARGFAGERRIFVLFQPHRYSRTKLLFDDFVKSFAIADEVIVTDVYAAGEQPLDGVSGEKLAQAIAKTGVRASYVPKAELAEEAASRLQKGDVAMTMGAGDIGETALEIKRIYEHKVAGRV